jgi:hypothetical protein
MASQSSPKSNLHRIRVMVLEKATGFLHTESEDDHYCQ